MAHILIVAGEASGDRIGALLIRELKKITSRHSFIGVGGAFLEAEGVELIGRSGDIDVIGGIEGLSKLPNLYHLYMRLRELILKEKVDVLILIDYPGMNLRLAQLAHKVGIPVIYYVSPQIWAWRPGRIKKMRKTIGRMLVILPFETKIYEKAKIPVSYVGHPLIDMLPNEDREFLRKTLSIKENEMLIALLPGSRKQEIKYLLPEIAKSAVLLKRELEDVKFIIAVAPSLDEEYLHEKWTGLIGDQPIDSILIKGESLKVLLASDVAIVASGTASLEAGLIGVPQVVVYKVNPITYWIGKKLVKVRWLSLVNNILNEQAVPELIQHKMKAELIAEKTKELLFDEEKREILREKTRKLKELLGPAGASHRAALEVEEFLEGIGL